MNTSFVRILGGSAIVAVALAASARAAAPVGQYTVTATTVYDVKTKLTWQRTHPTTLYNLSDAKTYCVGLSLGGTGWRLPTTKELQTIVDYSQATPPTIDRTAFPGTFSDHFWSSTANMGAPFNGWSVTFYFGGTSSEILSATHYVRCVR